MRKFALYVLVTAVASAAQAAQAEAAPCVRSFDGPELAWQLADGRPTAKVLAHGLVSDEAREGSGSERVSIVAPGGEALHFICRVGRVPVMAELESRMWLKSTRPGAKLAARVVLPRTADPKSGAVKSVLVSSGECSATDRWQQMRLSNVPELLAAQVRVLRAAQGGKIDPREAYVDAMVLVVPGGAGSTTVWTDGLELDGIVLTATTDTTKDSEVAPAVFSAPAWPTPHASVAQAVTEPARSSPAMQFRGTTLILADRPFLPRGIEWNNEPFAFLAERGFNTIWLDEPPTPEQNADATRSNLWLVCRPPTPERLSETGLGGSLDRVLAWNLGRPSGPQELDYYRRWAGRVRNLDPLSSRPILLAPRGDWLPASQLADALVAEHPAGGTLAEGDFAEWLRQLPLLARPGTPLWASIPTQSGERTRSQASAMSPNAPAAPTVLDDSQIAALVNAAANNACRGFVLRSNSPLNATDETTRRRAALLERVNDRLDLIAPWLTIGKQVGDAASTDGSVSGIVLQAERARLFVPTSSKGAAAATPDQAASDLAFIIPGIPESNEAFLLSPAGFRALASKRVAGGTRIEIARGGDDLVLLTEDPTIIASYRQRTARGAQRVAQLQYELAATRMRSLAESARRLQRLGVNTKQLDEAIGAANSELKTGNSVFAAKNFEAAYRHSSRGLQILAAAIDEASDTTADGPAFNSLPTAGGSVPLAPHAEFERSLSSLRPGENQLVGGDFEDLGQLRQAGWQHVEDPIPGIATKVELSSAAPREGRYSLQLVSRPDSPGHGPQIVARAPVWITTPPLRATAGEVLEISGWVRVMQPILGNIDGFEIIDSLGGRELSLRVRETADWQPFRLIRSTKETTNVTLTFALHGLGAACVDGVMVRSLAAPSVKRLPTVTQVPGPAFSNSARRTLFSTPPER